MPRSLAVLLACGLLVLSTLALASGVAAATIAPTVSCSNNVDTTPGLGLICEVTVVNTITSGGGTATVTVRECHGAANDAEAACTTTTDTLTEPVTAVTQCNGSTSSGATVECSIDVTNNFVGVAVSPTAVTVNQCVGSGDGITTGCDPIPSATTGAAITQCNGSANGGTLVELTCTATGTQSAALVVTINQCNGSANGGGSSVICTANMENNAVAGATPRPGATPRVTPPATDANVTTETPGSGPLELLLAGLFFVAFVVLVATRRSLRSLRAR